MVSIHLFIRQSPFIRLISDSIGNSLLPGRDGRSFVDIENDDFFDERLMEGPDGFHHPFYFQVFADNDGKVSVNRREPWKGLKPLSFPRPLQHLAEVQFK